MAEEKPLVTITGISGYIGSWVTLYFLQDGGYRVRGTVRDKNNAAKLEPLKTAFGEELYNQLELVEADLLNEQSMIDACAGSAYIVHVASPFFFSPNEDELVKPAVDGTNGAMKAAQAAGARRIIVTSSCAAIQCLAEADKPPKGSMFDESHWSDLNRPEGMGAYLKSKTLAEKAAWDFQAALPEDQRFEVTTICPSFVMGPPLRTEPATSTGWLKRLMEGTMDTISADHCCAVDVRDTARAHVLAVKNAAAANRRFILCHSSPSFQDYAGPVIAKYRPLGWPITENMGEAKPDEYVSLFNNAASRELGVEYTDWSQTMVDMADAMVELGMVTKP